MCTIMCRNQLHLRIIVVFAVELEPALLRVERKERVVERAGVSESHGQVVHNVAIVHYLDLERLVGLGFPRGPVP